MELHAHHVAALDGCGERLDVMRDGGGVGGDGAFVGVREVDELAGLDAGKKPRAQVRTPSEFQPTCGTFSWLSAKRVHDSGKWPRPGCSGASVDPA